ncbi:hypothetical protein BofuT4_uP000450.1 [Botrytis cinerea T4]|uniref:Uncharacterized protein n=1 Tax=Botryotinia fuckeliana (strain T4) TaxID=999810 RepID=G2YLV0_BOTF4|nr:hypothetical protein BofuT4_uP000450.1 [Botrytis cinerea T4]
MTATSTDLRYGSAAIYAIRVVCEAGGNLNKYREVRAPLEFIKDAPAPASDAHHAISFHHVLIQACVDVVSRYQNLILSSILSGTSRTW